MCRALSSNTLHDYKVLTLQKHYSANPEKRHVEMEGSQTLAFNNN